MIKSLGKYEKRLAIFLAIGILIRIFISTKTAYYQDINIFKLWSLDLITQGFRNFYSVAISDYLPGYLYVVWFLGKVFWWFLNKGVLLPFELVYKSPSILTDVATTLLIFQITKEYTNKKIAYLTSLFYFLNPVFFFNSTIWGQVESYTFFFMLLATFFFLRKNYFMSFAVLGYAQSIKPIAILILPIFLLLLILEKIQFKKILFYSLVFILVVFAVFTPFNPGENIISFVIERHGITSSFYQLTSLNAFNFWAMFSTLPSGNTYKLSDQTEFLNITYQYWGYAVFLSFYLGILYFLIKRFVNYEKNKIYIFYLLSLSYFALFLFLTRMHDRHLYYGLAFMVPALAFLPKNLKLAYFICFLIFLFNTYFAFRIPTPNPMVLPAGIIISLSLFLITLFLYLYKKLVLV